MSSLLTPAATTQLRRDLSDLPELLVYAELALLPGRSGGQAGHVTGATRTAPLPVRADVLSLLGPAPSGRVTGHPDDQVGPPPVLAVIASWAELVVETSAADLTEASHQSLSTATTGDQIRTLQATLAWAARQDWARDYATEIRRIVRQLSPLALAAPSSRPLPLPCPRCHRLTLAISPGADPSCTDTDCARVLRPAEYQDHAALLLDALCGTTDHHDVQPAGHPDTTEDTPMDTDITPGRLLLTQLHGHPALPGWSIEAMSTVLDTDGTTVVLAVRSRATPGLAWYATGTLTTAPRALGPTVTDLVTTSGTPYTHLVLGRAVGEFGTAPLLARATSSALDALAPYRAARTGTGPLGLDALPAAVAATARADAAKALAASTLADRNAVLVRLLAGDVQPAGLARATGLSKQTISNLKPTAPGQDGGQLLSA